MNTVFVLGAGASKDAKMPLGQGDDGLPDQIIELLKPVRDDGAVYRIADEIIRDAVQLEASNGDRALKGRYLRAAQHLVRALPGAHSIDSYLDDQREQADIVKLGKMAIVRAILARERASPLYSDPAQGSGRLLNPALDNAWYPVLRKSLMRGCRAEDLPQRLQNAGFIVFNYDRCLEQYLFLALQDYYPQIDAPAATKIVRAMNVIHPYGTVGSLLCSRNPQERSMEFGGQIDGERLLEHAAGIRTFTEAVDDTDSEIQIMRLWLENADRVVFLGFGYIDDNLELLFPKREPRQTRRATVFGTTLKISQPDVNAIRNWLGDAGFKDANTNHLVNCDCRKLFEDYSRLLRF